MIRSLYGIYDTPTTNTFKQQQEEEIDRNEQELVDAYLQNPILTRTSIQVANERATYALLNKVYTKIYPKVDELARKSAQPFFTKELQPDTAPDIIDYFNILKSVFKNKSSFTEEFQKIHADNLARLERGEAVPTPIDSFMSIFYAHQGSRTRQEMFDRATRTLELQEQINPKGFLRTAGEELAAGLLSMPLDPIGSILYFTSASGVFKAFQSKTLRSIATAAVEGGLKTVAERSLASIDSPDERGFFEGAGTTFAIGTGGYLALGGVGAGVSKATKATRDLINKQLRGLNTVEKNVQNLNFDLEKIGYNEVIKDVHPAMEGKVSSQLTEVEYNQKFDYVDGKMQPTPERLSAAQAGFDEGYRVTADGVGYEGEKLNADGRVSDQLLSKINKKTTQRLINSVTNDEQGLKKIVLGIQDIEFFRDSFEKSFLESLNVAIEDTSNMLTKGGKTSLLSDFRKGFREGKFLGKVMEAVNSGTPLEGEYAFLQPVVRGLEDYLNNKPGLYNQSNVPQVKQKNKQIIIPYDRGTVAEILDSGAYGKNIFVKDHMESFDWDRMAERAIELEVKKPKPKTPEEIRAQYKEKGFRKSKTLAWYEQKVVNAVNALTDKVSVTPSLEPQEYFFLPNKLNNIYEKYMGGKDFFDNFIADAGRQADELALFHQLGVKPIETLETIQKHFINFYKSDWYGQILNFHNALKQNSFDNPARPQGFEKMLAGASLVNGKILEGVLAYIGFDDPFKTLLRGRDLSPNRAIFKLPKAYREGINSLFHKDLPEAQRRHIGVYLQDNYLNAGRQFASPGARKIKKGGDWIYHNFFWKNDMMQRSKRTAGLTFDYVMKELIEHPKGWQSLTETQKGYYKVLGFTEKDFNFMKKHKDKGMYSIDGAFGKSDYIGAKGIYNHFAEIGDTKNALIARKILAAQERFRGWAVIEGSQINQALNFGGRMRDQNMAQWVWSLHPLKRYTAAPLNIWWQNKSMDNPIKEMLSTIIRSIITGMIVDAVKQGFRGKNIFAVFFTDEFKEKSTTQKSAKILSTALRWYAIGGYGGRYIDLGAMSASGVLDVLSQNEPTIKKALWEGGKGLEATRTSTGTVPAVAFTFDMMQAIADRDMRKMARLIPGESFPLNILVQRLLIDNYYANFTDEEEAIKRFQKEKEDAARRGQPYFDMLAPGSFTKLDMLEADEKNK